MKKLAWLVALPWVVKMSTCNIEGQPGNDLWLNAYDRQVLTCNHSKRGKESADDLAFALNEAHQERLNPSIKLHAGAGMRVIEDTSKHTGVPFNYKAACGGDDCGKDQ